VATLTSFASAETQSVGSPAEQFRISPALPYTNTYGCSETTPPDTETLLLKVTVIAPIVVVALESTTLVEETDTTVVFAGTPVPVTVWPAPMRTSAAASVIVVVLFEVADSENTPIWLIVVPVMSPISTGVLLSSSMAAMFWPG